MSRPISNHGSQITEHEEVRAQELETKLFNSSTEVNVLPTQNVIDTLSDRIERAYSRRRLGWRGVCSTSRVWARAAETLLKAHETDDSLPLDPELFVLAQTSDTPFPDPWIDLTGDGPVGCYRRRVIGIVAQLRGELVEELRLVERKVRAGESLAKVLLCRNRRLSPLGRYIISQRAGRPALSNRFLHDAAAQHRACPLYRQACSDFIPTEVYPVPEAGEWSEGNDTPPAARPRSQFHLN